MAASIWVDLLGAEVRYVQSPRFRTRTIQAGAPDAPALLLLHGIGGHAEAYSRNLLNLAQTFRVIALDFVWHGYSSTPPFVGESIPTYAAQVLEVMDTLGLERAHVEGESLGGWVAMWLALHQPERLHKIVLNTPGGVHYAPGSVEIRAHEGVDALRDRSLAVLQDPSPANVRKRLEWLMASPDRVTDELVAVRQRIYSQPETNAALRQVFAHRFSPEGTKAFHLSEADVAQIGVPTLVQWTDHNPGMGLDVGARLAQLIPGAQFAPMQDAAHWPQWEKPAEHDRVVTQFLTA